MKNILIIKESTTNAGSIINLDKICMIYKMKDRMIGFAFDDDENQANWLFDDEAERNRMYDKILFQISENCISTIQ